MVNALPTEMVSLCVSQIQTALQSIAVLKNKNIAVLNEEELFEKGKLLIAPFAGILYEGLRASGENTSTAKVGIAAEMVVSIILVTTSPKTAPLQDKFPTLTLLDTVRNTMLSTRSMTGHWWRFIVEAPASEKNGAVLWVQRWSTPALLRHN